MTRCDVYYYVTTGYECRKHGKLSTAVDAWSHARTDPFTGQIENRLDILFAELLKIHLEMAKE